jgi:hypothetical protein
MSYSQQYSEPIEVNNLIDKLQQLGFKLENPVQVDGSANWFITNHESGARVAFQVQGKVLSYKLHPKMLVAQITSGALTLLFLLLNGFFQVNFGVSLGSLPLVFALTLTVVSPTAVRKQIYTSNYSYLLDRLESHLDSI